MAKLITTYDSTLKEKVFVLKGEEAYAKSTDTVLTELNREEDWNRHLDYMLIGFEVDVHRNVGESSIVLYDNEDVIDVIPFDLGSSSVRWEKYYDEDTGEWVDNRMKLAYDVEHNIYAKYMGNKQCLKSQSKVYQFSEEMPDAYLSALEFVDVDSYYDADYSVDINVQLVADDYYDGETITLYDGGSLLATATTNNDGIAVFENINILQGLHNFVARFKGTEFLMSSETSMMVSGGYTISIIEKPSYIINNAPTTIKVIARDYLNNPKSNADITIQQYEDDEWVDVSSSVYTNRSGLASISPTYLTTNPFRAINTQFDYVSDEQTVNFYDDVEVSLSIEDNITAKGYSLPITGSVTNVSEPIEVNINYIGTVTTDENGNFFASYKGTGEGSKTITASVYGASDSETIEDYVQYWKVPSKILNRQYVLENYSILIPYTNGFGLTLSPTAGGSNRWASINFNGTGYDISFKVVSTNATIGVTGSNSEVQIKSGDTVRIRYTLDGSYYRARITVGGLNKLDEYIPSTTSRLGFKIYNSTSAPNLIFDDLRILRGV